MRRTKILIRQIDVEFDFLNTKHFNVSDTYIRARFWLRFIVEILESGTAHHSARSLNTRIIQRKCEDRMKVQLITELGVPFVLHRIFIFLSYDVGDSRPA